MKTVTTRFRQSPEERAELEELREWCEEHDLSGLLRRAIDALKEESGFDLRDVELGSGKIEPRKGYTKAEPRPAVPAFVPGFRPRTEGK